MADQTKYNFLSSKIGKYTIVQSIGKGSEGTVYKVRCNKQEFALKQINKCFSINLKVYQNIKPNDNLVQFIESFSEKGNQYEVQEYCNEGNLTKKMQKQSFDQYSMIIFLRQFCNGYKELITNNIIHRDIKPDNIVYHNGVAKIADFGFARFVLNPQMMEVISARCTPLFASPQIFDQYFSSKCDMWSLGLILYQLLYGYLPNEKAVSLFDLFNFFQQAKNNKIQYLLTDQVELLRLIKQMLQYREEDRIDWKSLFNHPFVTGNEESRLDKPLQVDERQVARYFENKIEQFSFFNSLLLELKNNTEQEMIVLNLWYAYILHLRAQINGTVLVQALLHSQLIYIKSEHCKKLKKIIQKFTELLEDQIKFYNLIKINNDIQLLVLNPTQALQQFDTSGMIDKLSCHIVQKEQIKYILNN